MPARCTHCLTRRDFLAAASAAGLSTLAACGDGFLSGVGGTAPPPPGGPLTITVGDFPQLANTGVLVQIPNQSIAVKRVGPSSFDAFSMLCTHQQCLVGITDGQRFDCPCHQSRFGNNGEVLRGPAQDPLPKYTTSYNAATDQLTIS